jgi:hypothetical protein
MRGSYHDVSARMWQPLGAMDYAVQQTLVESYAARRASADSCEVRLMSTWGRHFFF